MTVETEDMRLQFLKDIEVTDWTFTDTSAGTTATITALLRKEYLEVKVEGVVGVQNNAQFAFVRTSDVPSIQQGDTISTSRKPTSLWAWCQMERGWLIKDLGPKYCGNRKVRMKWQL